MIIRVSFTPAVPEEARAAYLRNHRERFLPVLAQQPGLVAGFWGMAADQSTRSITVWDSRELMEAGGRAAAAVPLLPGFTPADTPSGNAGHTVEILDVVAHCLPGNARG